MYSENRWNNAGSLARLTQLGVKKNFLVIVPSFFCAVDGQSGNLDRQFRDKLNQEVTTEVNLNSQWQQFSFNFKMQV